MTENAQCENPAQNEPINDALWIKKVKSHIDFCHLSCYPPMHCLKISNWIAISASVARYIIKDYVIRRDLAEIEMSALGCSVHAFWLILQGFVPDVIEMKAIAVFYSLVRFQPLHRNSREIMHLHLSSWMWWLVAYTAQRVCALEWKNHIPFMATLLWILFNYRLKCDGLLRKLENMLAFPAIKTQSVEVHAIRTLFAFVIFHGA